MRHIGKEIGLDHTCLYRLASLLLSDQNIVNRMYQSRSKHEIYTQRQPKITECDEVKVYTDHFKYGSRYESACTDRNPFIRFGISFESLPYEHTESDKSR